ncbi:hypothetical protein GO308_09635 [Sphingomonas sp. SFZ2018-12]|uniref:hypothetical protein n=1 Tax=Sphingomonas sp. SFZ2018-12 TaxID=2683197 RepID=UPI001F0D5433|nr:hypothetical protein [Sphingomonas sp. SFZ2018-12]MCH4893369.1 hypothetical protein [Sphingomonas sp. SFZ2018-12]
MRYALMASSVLLALAGCTKAVTKERTVDRDVYVPVPVGCVLNRPASVTPLRQLYTEPQWAALAPGARGQALRAQGNERLNHEQAQEAALSGCKDAPAPP